MLQASIITVVCFKPSSGYVAWEPQVLNRIGRKRRKTFQAL